MWVSELVWGIRAIRNFDVVWNDLEDLQILNISRPKQSVFVGLFSAAMLLVLFLCYHLNSFDGWLFCIFSSFLAATGLFALLFGTVDLRGHRSNRAITYTGIVARAVGFCLILFALIMIEKA